MNIKTGDKVRVIAGKDKGKEGTVTKVILKTDRVVVEGVNKVKKHQKPTQAEPKGGIVEKEAALHVSNVKLVDASSQKNHRVNKNDENKK
ncbi:50S ribosomal protein L24 [Oenococcus kitaharae]|uniref:Large ribosomal subunit protein uL24 n=1 Tax=Oenococcus kitaharae DSM 17330 TaxID=1045004 RepID=G9WFI8_9LACO|nr:50S ribosomal protein L24 [Oenococcus kitaharae]EHN59145.1 LSU ribosomal protein L24p (L26e) [Oenococcus kitaharae DSM 17330]OEY81977.1 50S ribosomal protein L24 [Oenococcus kitaharae]OEY82348.1 50S ribosomal protein L24 [Oenococcus kitaharae]OEY82754.1 50S ribosomal protein L24 [Oenococcus kitaharae]